MYSILYYTYLNPCSYPQVFYWVNIYVGFPSTQAFICMCMKAIFEMQIFRKQIFGLLSLVVLLASFFFILVGSNLNSWNMLRFWGMLLWEASSLNKIVFYLLKKLSLSIYVCIYTYVRIMLFMNQLKHMYIFHIQYIECETVVLTVKFSH